MKRSSLITKFIVIFLVLSCEKPSGAGIYDLIKPKSWPEGIDFNPAERLPSEMIAHICSYLSLFPNTYASYQSFERKGHKIRGIKASPDISYVAVRYDDNIWWVFGMENESYKRLNSFEREGHQISGIGSSQDYSCIIVRYDDNICWIFGRKKGSYKHLNVFEREGHQISEIKFNPDGSYVTVNSYVVVRYEDNVSWIFGREDGNYKHLDIFERKGHRIRFIKSNPDKACVYLRYDDNVRLLWKRIPKHLLEGPLTLKQHLFISLLLNNMKNGQPTSLVLLAKHLQAKDLNITLVELEDIFFSFDFESQVFLAEYFDIVEYKVYEKFKSLDPEFNFDKQCFIQILRQYRIENPKLVKVEGVNLSDLEKFAQDNFVKLIEPMQENIQKLKMLNCPICVSRQKFLENTKKMNLRLIFPRSLCQGSKLCKICNRNIGNLDVRKIFQSFSEKAKEFLKYNYLETEKSSCIVS